MINQDNTEIGWGANQVFSTQKRTAKYEFGLYKNGELIEVFRTDVREVAGNLERKAVKCAELNQISDLKSNYCVKKIIDRKPLPVIFNY